MALEIYADGIKLDLPNTVKIAFTFQVNDIAELKDRQASFSNQFKAPRTPTNDKALGFASQSTTGNRLQYSRINCLVVDDGIQVIPDGFLIVENFEKEYGLTIYAGTLNLFEGMDSKFINELREVSDRHFWSNAAARGSLINASNYRYFLADYGGTVTGLNVSGEYLLPWVSRRKIWDKIFQSAGFSVTGEPMNADELNKSYLLAFRKDHPFELVDSAMRVSDADSWVKTFSYIPATGFAPEFNTVVADPLAPLNPQMITAEPIGYSPVFPTNFINFSAFRCRIPGTYLIEWDVQMRTDMGTFINVFPGNTMQLKKIAAGDLYFTDAVNVGSFDVDNWDGTIATGGQYNQLPAGSEKLHKFTTKLTLQVGDLLFLMAENHPNNPAGSLPFFLGSASEFRIVELTEAPINFGDYVDPWVMLPEISHKNFVKGIAQELALTFDVDLMAKTCRVYSFSEVINNKQRAKDWSDKIVNLDAVRHEYHPGTYARENFFKYKTETGVSESLGLGSFTIDDDTLEETRDVLTLPWAATEMVLIEGEFLPQIKIYDAGEWSDPTSPRVLIADTYTPGSIFSIGGTALPASYPVAWFYVYGRDLNLDWPTLLGKYYPDLILAFQNYLKTILFGILQPGDVTALDFSLPVYLRQYSAYYYLNKINQYRQNNPVKVELIRI